MKTSVSHRKSAATTRSTVGIAEAKHDGSQEAFRRRKVDRTPSENRLSGPATWSGKLDTTVQTPVVRKVKADTRSTRRTLVRRHHKFHQEQNRIFRLKDPDIRKLVKA